MHVEVEIFMSKIIKFFRENPNELYNLIPKGKEDDFFDKIRIVSLENVDKGEDATLTQKQIIAICVEINGENKKEVAKDSNIFFDTVFGRICLN
jgi:hypothetical protein